jgi:hypothetical protein
MKAVHESSWVGLQKLLVFLLLFAFNCVPQAQTLGEALNATNLTWMVAGNAPWFAQTSVTHDGVAAAQSGTITNRQSSILQTTITGPGTLVFWWEIANFDQGPCGFTLTIDGVQQTSTFGGWQEQTNYLGAGPHLVQWVFTNFLASGTLHDVGEVDEVSIVPGTTAPIIKSQPASQSQASGLDATFTVGAVGTPPLSYQWQFNGTNILGAQSSSYTVTNMQAFCAGNYGVIISNSADSIASSNAWLALVSVAAWDGVNDVPPDSTNILAIAVGDGHSLALRTDRTVSGWGNDAFGQTEAPIGLTNVIAIAAGYGHSLALKTDGTVVAWGRNDYGQTNVPPSLTNAIAIAAGGNDSVALTANGIVVAWGDNFRGETNVPMDLTNAVAISSGLAHIMALRDNGKAVVWGWNYAGLTNVPSNLTNVVAIAAGFSHCLALKADGTVVAWGDNYFGATNVPVGLGNVEAVSGGSLFSLALKDGGEVVAWGGKTNIPAGLMNVLMVSAGGYHSLAIVGDGVTPTHIPLTNPKWNSSVFTVSLPAQSGHVYRLEYTDSLTSTNWVALPLVAGNGRMLTLTDSTATNGANRFYRVRRW